MTRIDLVFARLCLLDSLVSFYVYSCSSVNVIGSFDATGIRDCRLVETTTDTLVTD